VWIFNLSGEHEVRPYKRFLFLGKNNLRMNQKKAKRRSIRLTDYDYSLPGAYFTTVCTKNGQCLFGEISNGKMLLNKAGEMLEASWKAIPDRFSFAQLDEFVIMPNHIHGIIILTDRGQKSENNISNSRGEPRVRPVSVHQNRAWPDSWHCQKQGEYKIRPYWFRPRGTLAGSLGRVMQAFKSIPARAYILGIREQKWTPFRGRLWQRGYYEHVVRNPDELNRIREYIVNNPAGWFFDHENPEVASQSKVGH